MAHDPATTARLRAALKSRSGIDEKSMFGGVCFTLREHMLCISGSKGFMFRVGEDGEAEALAQPGTRPVVMGGGRRFGGFVWVDPARCSDAQLPGWIARAERYVAALPPKAAKAKKPTAKKVPAKKRKIAARKKTARKVKRSR